MNDKEIFQETISFCMAKIGLAILFVLMSMILGLVVLEISNLFDFDIVISIVLCLGMLVGIELIRSCFWNRRRYLIEASHIAVIMEVLMTGKIPNNKFEYGKKQVKERFADINIQELKRLINETIKQIQCEYVKIDEELDSVGGVKKVLQWFLNKYINKCCLGYAFYQKEKSTFQSIADGIDFSIQNNAFLIKGAEKLLKKASVVMLGIFSTVFIILAIVSMNFSVGFEGAFYGSILVSWVLKEVFIDSYIMISFMKNYAEIDFHSSINFNSYKYLPKRFKELLLCEQEQIHQ